MEKMQETWICEDCNRSNPVSRGTCWSCGFVRFKTSPQKEGEATQSKDVWNCFCGQINDATEKVCHICGKEKPMSADAEEGLWDKVYNEPKVTGK